MLEIVWTCKKKISVDQEKPKILWSYKSDLTLNGFIKDMTFDILNGQ